MNIDDILTQVLYGKTTKLLLENEEKLDQIAENNYGELLLVLANYLSNEAVDMNKRKLSATILKNMIAKFPKHKEKWINLNNEIKESIKLNILSTLASQSKDIIYSSSDTIAGICSIDTPRNEWMEIYNILYKTALDEDPKVRLSSVLTIGYISEEVDPNSLSELHKNNLLYSIITNINLEFPELINITLDAFIKFIPMIKSNMEVETQRNIIMQKVYDIIKSQNSEEIIKNRGIVILEQIAKYYYDNIKNDIDIFIEISDRTFFSQHDEVIAGTFELWITISSEEALRQNRSREYFFYSNKALPNLIKALKYYFLNRNKQKEKADKDKWTIANSAGILISYLSQCTDETIIDFVFDLIREYIASDDSKIRESVIIAFGSILQTIYSKRIKDIIEGALPTLLNLLSDKNIDVRSTVAWCLRKITQYHTDCLISLGNTNPDLLDLFIQSLLKNLNSNKRVVFQLVDCLNYIVVKTKELFEEAHPGAPLTTCILSKYYSEILKSLISIAYNKESYDTENNIALASLFSFNSLIDFSPLDCIDIINQYFNLIVNGLDETFSKEFFQDEVEKKYNYQENLCAIINSYFIGDKIQLNADQCLYLYNILDKIFKERKSVFLSGLLLSSKLIIYTHNNAPDIFKEIFSNFCHYLYSALCQTEEAGICSMALGVIADFIRLLYEPFEEYFKEMFSLIFKIGLNPQLNRNLKIKVLNVFCDLFLTYSPIVNTHFYQIMQLLNEACSASVIYVNREEDEEFFVYIENLKTTTLETLSSFIVTTKEKEGKKNLVKFKDGIINYLNKLVLEISPTNEEILSSALGIYTEIYEVFQDESNINLDTIEKIILFLKSSCPNKYTDLIEWSKWIFISK